MNEESKPRGQRELSAPDADGNSTEEPDDDEGISVRHCSLLEPPSPSHSDLKYLHMRHALFVMPLLLVSSAAHAEPASTLDGMWKLLGACAQAVGGPAASVGSEVTVLFSIKRDGSLQGQPRITHSMLLGDDAAQKEFLAGVLGAVARCFPLSISDGLGGAVAGRPLRIRVMNRPKQQGV